MSWYWVFRNVLVGPPLRILGKPRVIGLQHFPTTGPVVVAANHLSVVDSFYLVMALPRRIVFIAKSEYFEGTGPSGRFKRWFFTSTGQIPVQRSGGEAAATALTAAARILEAGGVWAVHPEGSRSPDGRMHRGRTGAVRVAMAASAVLVPVSITGTDTVDRRGKRLWRFGHVRIEISPPLDISRYETDDPQSVRDATDALMAVIRSGTRQEYVDHYAHTWGRERSRHSGGIDMFDVQLSAGVIEYEDNGGTGPVLVFIHGLLMDGSGWRHVVDELRGDYRCIVPTWPLGAHRKPMNPDADLSLIGMGKLIAEFLGKLDLHDATLIQNDWGGAQIFIGVANFDRVTRLVLTSCEAFDNYPPRPARAIVIAARIPGGLRIVMALLNTRVGRRGPTMWGWLSKRPVPKDVIDAWFRPATEDRNIRRDVAKYVVSVPHRDELLDIASRSAEFTNPVLIVWATEDRMMPRAHGRRLAELFPSSRLVEIDDSYTLLPEDQPKQLTAAIAEFLETTRGEPKGLSTSGDI